MSCQGRKENVLGDSNLMLTIRISESEETCEDVNRVKVAYYDCLQ